MKALKWFVIEADVDGSWMDFKACDFIYEAEQRAWKIWDYAYSTNDRKHRRIEIARLWAVQDEGSRMWFPMLETDKAFDRENMEGYWIGSYNPVFTLGPKG